MSVRLNWTRTCAGLCAADGGAAAGLDRFIDCSLAEILSIKSLSSMYFAIAEGPFSCMSCRVQQDTYKVADADAKALGRMRSQVLGSIPSISTNLGVGKGYKAPVRRGRELSGGFVPWH